MRNKTYLIIFTFLSLFLLSACRKSNENVVLSNKCSTYNQFMNLTSKEFYKSLSDNGYYINKDNYYKVIPQITYLKINKENPDVDFDLNGIQCFPYLETLNLSGASIKDLTPLGELSNVETLELDQTRVSNLQSLQNMSMLRTLTISNTLSLTSLKGIENLHTLKTINLPSNNITSIQILENLANLSSLNVEDNRVEISELNGFNHLKKLNVRSNNMCNTDALSSIKTLTHLDISENCEDPIDYTFLQKLTNLEVLKASGNKIQTLEWLTEMDLSHIKELDLSNNLIHTFQLPVLDQLVILNLGHNKLETIDSIVTMKNLQKLSLESNNINDISQIIQLNELVDLDLSNNQIELIPSFDGIMKNLKLLNLSNNNIHEINQIQNLEKLEEIVLRNNQISTIVNSFNNMPNLRSIDLSETNQIQLINNSFNNVPNFNYRKINLLELNFETKDLEIKKSFNNVYQITEINFMNKDIVDIDDESFHLELATVVNVSKNNLTHIEWVRNLAKLRILHAGENNIMSISVLENNTELKSLYLNNNQITHVSNLTTSVLLEEIDLSYNNINNIEFIANMDLLTMLNVRNNLISDVSPLYDFMYLNSIDLSSNAIETVNGINNLPNIKSLLINENPISTINGFKNIDCEVLTLSNMIISDISSDSFTDSTITELNLSNNEIDNIQFLNNLAFVERIDLSNNKVTDVSSFEGRRDVMELNLSNNPIITLTGLNEFYQLRKLYLPETITSLKNTLNSANYLVSVNRDKPENILHLFQLSSIENSLNSTSFIYISFPEQFGKDVTIVNSLSYTVNLDLNQTTFTTIDFIQTMRELQTVKLNESITEISNLSCSSLTKLYELDFSNSNLTKIENSFNDCSSLTTLIIDSKADVLTITNSFNNRNIINIQINKTNTNIVDSFNRNQEVLALDIKSKYREGDL